MKCLQKGCEVDGPTESGHCPVCGHVLVSGNGKDTEVEAVAVAVDGSWSEANGGKSHFFTEGEDSLCGKVSLDDVTLSDDGSDTEGKNDCIKCVDALVALGA